jgi:ABC-type polysaccharide/polyol phosphate transport system ATPase subunit
VNEPIIECRNVWKVYPRHSGARLLRQHILGWWHGTGGTAFEALKGVNLSVRAGEGVAIVGGNGAGKSTLLSVVAGLAKPDRGSVTVNGRVVALLELGSGFHPDLTGIENVYLNAALLGFSEERIRKAFDSVVEFSEIGDFIREPLRTYSSGMVLRLAFAVAVHVEAEVMIVDEVLAVGDKSFQEKCFDRIRQLRKNGRTFFCVSHNRAMVEELCERAVWLDHGAVVMDGEIGSVFEAYEGRIIRPQTHPLPS